MSNTRKASGIPQAPTAASAWKKQGDVLTLPSGNTIRVKNPGIMELAHQGLVPNSLMNIMMDAIQKGKEPSIEDLLTEEFDVAGMLGMMDNSIIHMAVEPEIHPIPVWTEEDVQEERCSAELLGKPAQSQKDSSLLYIDEVSEQDKMFIWQWATGGTADVEQFRSQSSNMLGSLPGLSPVAKTTKRAPARKR